jgi:CRP/FNR family transcriptional regulator, cyclic AMP receptor protein
MKHCQPTTIWNAKMLAIETARKIAIDHGWLSLTPPSFQRMVLDRRRLQRFKTGQSIYMVGDPPGGMFGLVSGRVGISIAPGERGPYFAHLGRPGTWFGEAAAILRQPRRVGLTATREAELLYLPVEKIAEIVTKDLNAWRLFALVTVGHLEMAIGACDDLMLRDHVKRCIATLLRLGGCRNLSPQCSSPIEIDACQDEIATLANVARATAGSVLRTLEGKGLIEKSYRRIRILAPDTLRGMLRE